MKMYEVNVRALKRDIRDWVHGQFNGLFSRAYRRAIITRLYNLVDQNLRDTR